MDIENANRLQVNKLRPFPSLETLSIAAFLRQDVDRYVYFQELRCNNTLQNQGELCSKRRGATETENAVTATKEGDESVPDHDFHGIKVWYADSERTFHAAYRRGKAELFFGGPTRYNQVKESLTRGGPNGMTNAPGGR